MARIAITGISGFLGQRVHHQLRLAGHDIVGIDLRTPADSEALAFHQADVRSRPDVARALADVDAVVHLAASTAGPVPDHDVNVGGSQVVVSEAVAAGVDTLVVLSSAMVYGARPDNPVPLHEDAPLRADPDFPLAAQKVQVEHLVAELVEDPEAPRTVVLRPALLVGADAENMLTRSLQGPRLLTVRGYHPPVQFVHVDDVAAAVVVAIEQDLRGPYNVACDGWMASDDVRAAMGRRVLEVPADVAFSVVDRSHALGLTSLPAPGLAWVMHPWVVATDRLRATGWQPTIDNQDAAALLATEQADRIVVGTVEADRATVRRVGLAAAGVVGGVLAMGMLARSRRSAAHDDPEGAGGADGPADASEGGGNGVGDRDGPAAADAGAADDGGVFDDADGAAG